MQKINSPIKDTNTKEEEEEPCESPIPTNHKHTNKKHNMRHTRLTQARDSHTGNTHTSPIVRHGKM